MPIWLRPNVSLSGLIALLISCESHELPDWVGADSLKPIISAQHDFHDNDRDGNGKHDFWRSDVAGLATLLRDGKQIATFAQANFSSTPPPTRIRLGGPSGPPARARRRRASRLPQNKVGESWPI